MHNTNLKLQYHIQKREMREREREGERERGRERERMVGIIQWKYNLYAECKQPTLVLMV